MGLFSNIKYKKLINESVKFFNESVKRDTDNIVLICKSNEKLIDSILDYNRMFLIIYFSVLGFYTSVLVAKGLRNDDVLSLIYSNIINLSDALEIQYTEQDNPLLEMYLMQMKTLNEMAEVARLDNNDPSYVFAKTTMLCIIPSDKLDLNLHNSMEKTIDDIRLYFNNVMVKSTF